MVRALLLLHRHGQDSKNRCAYFSQDELLYRRTFPCCVETLRHFINAYSLPIHFDLVG